ncbi:unnamed protein product [Zymoseptoria tritici ST99CH_1A5]|uniref:SnoaL-like domain-containing protein n=4 Tax=Zymoseptoria tritici TaxID=1047171 RepID=F9XKJ8_ZYMTI|nr:uncharacterized protein MYCGRDRAFT_105822 [Zymoseptoria tritici IPO323]SMQ54419.1 unnamed protein product [Zymoseptoria tritici ST99CH_3D7]SMR58851.1 unnamed protein product [Zymoseptoria tritici ST99CH_1E4]SMR62691.1 unnamed protein product [Zymoseptoria tritici ST99CH_3D1]SMY28067.1 unnamed protein product [Zymoseptoria tritici ST99CH_1A5]EGP83720.1 hypothetical protein MYCGRDRAFT_105822 [Zymoseptoria tritici IPO323]
MRPFAPQLTRTIANPTLTAARSAPITAFRFNPTSFTFTPKSAMSSTTSSSQYGELKVENTNINTAPGVDLTSTQKTLLGSVLDLFAGRPSLAKLQLWTDDATFTDPITIAEGRKQYEPQWYGLQKAFSEIERKSHEVTSGGNPIEMDMTTRYVVKGINKEQTISSKVKVHLDAAGEKIVKVEDLWNGDMDKDSSFKNALRKVNANTVPLAVKVPKNAEEDAKMGNQ